MAKVDVKFTRTRSSGVKACWILVNSEHVKWKDGKSTHRLDDTKKHKLGWYFTGNPGENISIKAEVGDKEILSVTRRITGTRSRDFDSIVFEAKPS